LDWGEEKTNEKVVLSKIFKGFRGEQSGGNYLKTIKDEKGGAAMGSTVNVKNSWGEGEEETREERLCS